MASKGGSAFGYNESKPVDMTPQQYKNLRREVSGAFKYLLGGASGKGASGGNPFGGSPLFQNLYGSQGSVAPMGEAEMAALNQVGGMGGQSLLDPRVNNQISQTLRGDYLSPESNPFLQKTIEAAQRPITQQFRDQNLERQALFSRAGQSLPESSPFARAQAIGNEGYANALGDVSANIAGENYRLERDRQQNAVNQASQVDQARFTRALGNLEAQALPRMIADMGIERGMQEYNDRIAMLMNILGMGAQVSSPTLGTESYGFDVSQG